MAITNGYCTLAELKARLDIDDYPDDSIIELVIESVSRGIDEYKKCRFFASTETRTYTATSWDFLPVDWLLSVTTLKTDDDADGTYETTWSSTDYILQPQNAATGQFNSTAYQWIEPSLLSNATTRTFPTGVQKGVQIVGSFGFNSGASTAAPVAIRQACLLMAARVFKRKDMPFGVSAGGAIGTQLVAQSAQDDGEIRWLLDSVKTHTAVRSEW